MEKYRKFADHKSGINPFVPIKPKNANTLLKYTLGPILVLLRLPVVLYCLGVLFLYHSLIKKFIAVKALNQLITSTVDRFMYKVIALCFGLFEYKTVPKFNPKDPNRAKLESGHVILCNHTHPLDFLYFTQNCSPIFAKLCTDNSTAGDNKVSLAPLDFVSTMKYFLTTGFQYPNSKTPSNESSTRLSLAELAFKTSENKEGPIVLFFEGALTNGKGVLEMPESLTSDIYHYQDKSKKDTTAVSIIYGDNAEASVANPIIASLSLMMNPTNKVTVRLCPITKLPIQPKDMARTIYDVYENIHQMPRMALKSEDYQAFLDYWRSTQKKNYVEKTKKDL